MLLHAIEQIARSPWFEKKSGEDAASNPPLRLYRMRAGRDEKGKLTVHMEPTAEEYPLPSLDGLCMRAEPDPSNRQANSLKTFWKAQSSTDVEWPFFGAASLFRNNIPNTISWAAFSQGLLASPVFQAWCKERKIRSDEPASSDPKEKVAFQRLEVDGVWALPILGESADGYLVLGIEGSDDASLQRSVQGAPIDWSHSRELGKTLRELPAAPLGDPALQMSSGLGFNPFGKGETVRLDALPKNERERLIGFEPEIQDGGLPLLRERLWSELCYPAQAGCHADDRPRLLFIPDQPAFLEVVVNSLEIQRRRQFRRKAEEADEEISHRPDLLPAEAAQIECTVLLAVQTGGNKPKVLVEHTYHPVNFQYWRLINEFNANPIAGRKSLRFDFICQEAGRWAIGGNEKFLSAKRIWTDMLGSLLDRKPLSARQVFSRVQAALKAASADEIRSGKSKRGRTTPSAAFRDLLEALPRANALIDLARTVKPEDLTKAFANLNPKPLMEATIEIPNLETILGKAYLLSPWAVQNKVDRLARATAVSIPKTDLEDYLWGAFCGGWLAYFERTVEQMRAAGFQRQFDALSGTHLTKLRGPRLVERATRACAVLRDIESFELRKKKNVSGRTRSFMETVKFLLACQQRSRRSAFNTGFCFGLIEYNDKAPKGEDEAESAEVKN